MSNPLDTCPTCKGLGDIRVGRSNNSIKVESCPTCHGNGQILETGKPDTWRNEGVGKWFHNKCGQSHLMDKPCHPVPVQAKPEPQPPTRKLDNDLEGIIAQHNMDALNRNVPADTISVSHAAVKILLLNAKEAGKREGAIAELKLIPHWRDGVFINDGMAEDSYYFKRLAELNEQENNHV